MMTILGAYLLGESEPSWQNGLDVVRAMAPEFRANLGPAGLVEDLFARYEQRTLLLEKATTRRIDLIRVLPDYRDLTNAFHDSVEECLVLDGSLHLDGEGDFVAGDYFWRPAGWVHAASTEEGFTALLMFQGDDPSEGSGPTSRRIRPDDEAGTNQLHPFDESRALGPRGWVRCQPTGLLSWLPGPDWSAARRHQLATWDLDRVHLRVLSENVRAGGQTLLVRMDPGATSPATPLSSAFDLFVLEGSLEVGEQRLGTHGFLHVPVGSEIPALRTDDGVLLFIKTSSWLGAVG